MILKAFDIIIINSSAGKDSVAAMWQIHKMAIEQGYPLHKIHVSHQELGIAEWEGTKFLAEQQAGMFGFKIHFSRRVTKEGRAEELLDYVERRGMWPSNGQRYCTSDFKRAPGGKVVRRLTKGMGFINVLHVFGFRKEESPNRAKKERIALNTLLTTKKRIVLDYLPVHDWTLQEVWQTIKGNNIPYHKAYDLGMPRLSCVFCIFSPFDALVLAGRENYKLLEKYVEVEEKIGHSFRVDCSLRSVKAAIDNGYKPSLIANWVM